MTMECGALLNIRRIGQAAAGKKAGDYTDLPGFIFVSSANSTTPFHIDAEENILVQIRGDKFRRIFDNRDRALMSEEAMESAPSKHRNQITRLHSKRAPSDTVKHGDAVHIPYLWPHGCGPAGAIRSRWR